MIEIDIKKTHPPIRDKWDAIHNMNQSQNDLLEALHIMISMIENDSEEFKESHYNRIDAFIEKFIIKN